MPGGLSSSPPPPPARLQRTSQSHTLHSCSWGTLRLEPTRARTLHPHPTKGACGSGPSDCISLSAALGSCHPRTGCTFLLSSYTPAAPLRAPLNPPTLFLLSFTTSVIFSSLVTWIKVVSLPQRPPDVLPVLCTSHLSLSSCVTTVQSASQT